MEAITREEKIMPGENLTPITRKEMFLAKAAGQNIETPEPITREEMFLSKISGGAGGGGASPFYTARAHWDDMNGTYVLDTPSSEILEAGKTKICVIIVTEVSGAQTFYWQTMQGGSEVITFVNATPNQIAQLAVIKGEQFADVIVNNQLGN